MRRLLVTRKKRSEQGRYRQESRRRENVFGFFEKGSQFMLMETSITAIQACLRCRLQMRLSIGWS
jgi:hypothetical protein